MSAAPAPEHREGQVIPFAQPWSTVQVTEAHARYLESNAAITPAVAKSVGVRSITSPDQLPGEFSWLRKHIPGLMFPWTTPSGEVKMQYRPDDGVSGPDVRPRNSDDKPVKYVHAQGSGGLLGAVRVVPGATRALLVEGTKQSLAAASYAPGDMSVYAVAGCRNWSSDGTPSADLEVFDGVETFVIFDADLKTNMDVWTAAQNLELALKAEGATKIRWVTVPAGAKSGLDDVLAVRPDARRALYLERMINEAGAKLPTKPRKLASAGSGGGNSGGGGVSGTDPHDDHAQFFDDKTGLLVADLADALRKRYPAVLTREHKVALYQDGVYHLDGTAFSGAVSYTLHNRFRPAHRVAVEEFMVGALYRESLILPDNVEEPLLNLKNGMLNLDTLEMLDHDPIYLSGQQLPIEWDPDAVCPTYENWAADVIPGQMDDLEESAATMLDPTRTPSKAVFLFGPSRSGKSTFLRLMVNIAGAKNTSAVTLHQITSNRFTAARVYGKLLNCAADLSAQHVEDLSIFKMLTGEDPVEAEFKGSNHFSFVNKALFAFSANELPTVGESSSAYTERIKPFQFGRSFAGRENPDIEAAMRRELPGILRRWVMARQRMRTRGHYLATDASVQREFEIRSDRVRQFVEERCIIHPARPGEVMAAAKSSTKSQITEQFNRWATDQARSKMGRDQIIARMMHIPGITEVRALPNKGRALNITVRHDGDEGPVVEPYEIRSEAAAVTPVADSAAKAPAKKRPAAAAVTEEVAPVVEAEPEPVEVPVELWSQVTTWVPEDEPAVSPFSALQHLLPEANTPPCRDCGGARSPVPPALLWFACPACHPETFERN